MGDEGHTPSGFNPAGLRAFFVTGPNSFPAAFSYFLFLFSFSGFPYFFHIICNLIQIKPTHFHKFCKIHSKVLNQYETYFQNQKKFFNEKILIEPNGFACIK
jgi:hypothetical protein